MIDWKKATPAGVWVAILVFLLIVSVHGNWRTGSDLQRVCELLGPHDVSIDHPRTAKQEIDNICIGHAPD